MDADPRPGTYIVTGSQQFGLLAGVTESLAGRAAFLTLLPFSAAELKNAEILSDNPFQAMIKGFYPPVHDREVSPYDWYTHYIASCVERDVRSIINVKDLGQFQTFVKMCASRIGQLLNLSALALDCGLSHNTARYSAGIDPGIHFWRDNIGTEVDIVFEESLKLRAIEVKSGKTFSPELASGLETWMRYSGAQAEECSLVYAGERAFQWKGISLVPWNISGTLI